MSLMSRIKSFLLALPFGMKGAEDEIMVQKMNSASDVGTIQDVVHQDSLGLDLLKGEVTQQVEELRYRTYEVYKESMKYKYVGEGIAIKQDVPKPTINTKTFTQKNKMQCNGILDEINENLNKYQVNIIYEDIPKYKLESLIEYVKVKIDEYNCYVEFILDKNLGEGGPQQRSFINYLNNSMLNGFRNCDFANLNNVSFTTFKCDGEQDLIHYTFTALRLDSYIEDGNNLILKYQSRYWRTEDLTQKYNSETMKHKYEIRAPKEVQHSFITDEVRKRKCDVCGKEISTYDGDITEISSGKAMCLDCLTEYLYKQEANEDRN